MESQNSSFGCNLSRQPRFSKCDVAGKPTWFARRHSNDDDPCRMRGEYFAMEGMVAGGEFDPRDGFIKVERTSISGGLCPQDRFDLQKGHRYGGTELTPPT
jgi:hypothetical protein